MCATAVTYGAQCWINNKRTVHSILHTNLSTCGGLLWGEGSGCAGGGGVMCGAPSNLQALGLDGCCPILLTLTPEEDPADGPLMGTSFCTHLLPFIYCHPIYRVIMTIGDSVSLLLLNGLLWTVNVNYHGRGCTYRLNILCFPIPSGQLQCPMCNNVFSAKWTCCNISL